MKIVIQGDQGSNHHLITNKLFTGLEPELISADSFKELAETLEGGDADLAVMAIENTIAGSILGNFDLLTKCKFKVIAEGYLRIEHCLISFPGAKSSDIKVAYSHEMALKQCEEYISKHNIEAREYHDTAAAIPYVKGLGDKSNAAIAPGLAAEIYGMEILDKGIETNKENYTRFVVLKRKDDSKDHSEVIDDGINGHYKTMIEFKLGHEKGSLVKALQIMAAADFNLTKIESRPIIGETWHYRFYVDFLSKYKPDDIEQRLQLLNDAVEYYDVLGIFPQGKTYQP